MGRILGIDYGEKRIGLAHTDEVKLIASPLDTVPAKDIFNYLSNYFIQENVDSIVVGEPKTLDNKPALISKKIKLFTNKLTTLFKKPIYMIDERFTSKMAINTMVLLKTKKSRRKDKSLVDKISATIILQSYLDRIEKK
jgi:putative Holliday junction resolvase